MSGVIISFLNGRATTHGGIRAVVRNKTVHAGAASNYWASTEYNQNNAWNVNFGSGNTNNNKYNTMYDRALAALGEEYIISWIDAYDDCCKHKKSSSQCILYRLYAYDIISMAVEAHIGTYKPSKSIAFIVRYPRLREIFAANFRDRIVQHWIVIRIEPLLESRFVSQGNLSYNCRKGFGTLAAVNRLESMILQVSENYTKQTYVGKYDIVSFFMSIDVRILWNLLEPFVKENYTGNDMQLLLYLLRITIFHRPQDNCERRGNLKLWGYLDRRKSLFFALIFIGVAIGNITSQLLANFFLSFFDELMNYICKKYGALYIRFVDDYTIVASSTRIIKEIEHEARLWLANNLHLQLHENKVYIQEVKHGVKFVGTVIKPGRKYLSNTTWGKFRELMDEFEELCKSICSGGPDVEKLYRLEELLCSVNSYLGFAAHNNSYSILYKQFSKMHYFWKVCYPMAHLLKVKIKKPYQLREYLYGTYLQSRTAKPQGGRARHQSRNANSAAQFRCPLFGRSSEGGSIFPSGGIISIADYQSTYRQCHHPNEIPAAGC
ncbi:MAG: reverse transcriptase domain-containing protein [Candidatus Cryptobacteroides sp.]